MHTYQPRKFHFKGVTSVQGWRIKVYALSRLHAPPKVPLESAGRALLETELPQRGPNDHGYGFAIIHAGLDSNFVVVDYWHNENELCHRVFSSTKATPGDLRRRQPNESIACIWDLLVMHHERQAWVKHMMKAEADPEGYLADVLEGSF